MEQHSAADCLFWVPLAGWSYEGVLRFLTAAAENPQICASAQILAPQERERLLNFLSRVWTDIASSPAVMNFALLGTYADCLDAQAGLPESDNAAAFAKLQDLALKHACDYICGLAAERFKDSALNYLKIYYLVRQLTLALGAFHVLQLGCRWTDGRIYMPSCDWTLTDAERTLRTLRSPRDCAADAASVAAHTSKPLAADAASLQELVK